MIKMKRIVAGAAVTAALTSTTLGLGTGIASADQQLPSSPGITWKLDRGHGHGHDDDWGWDNRGDWRGGGDWNGPGCGGCGWVPPAVWQWVPPALWG
jgi:hypothetical protein